MADARSVSVRLRAEVAGYVAGMAQAATATRGVAAEAAKAATTHQKASRQIGQAAVVGGAALLGMAAAAVKTTADFDKAMSGVRAATHETASNMGLLREAAIQAGADTAFSASEAAKAEEQLAKAGVATKDVLAGGLAGALNLAAAGQLDVGDAAEIAASAMTQFGLAGSEVPHVADLLAAGAGKAQGSVQDMGLALSYVGPVAAAMGVSIEETAGSIALLASNGIVGEKAGTNLRGVLASLTSPSDQASKAMEQYGINVYDAAGKFVGFRGVAQQLQTSLGGLDQATRNQALGQIFGNQQLVGAITLMNSGAATVDAWTRRVNDQGYAAVTAAIQLDNLSGDVEKFTGSLQTALINSGSAGNDMARGVVQNATSVVNAYSSLPRPIQESVTAFGGIAGAAALAGGALLIMVPKIAATKAAMAELGMTSAATSKTLGLVGKGFTVVAIAAGANIAAEAIGRLGASHVVLDKLSTSLLQTAKTGQLSGAGLKLFDQGFGPFTNHATDSAEALHRFANNAELALGSGLSNKLGRLQDMGATSAQFREQVTQLDSALAQMASSGHTTEAANAFDRLMTASGLSGAELEKLKTMFPEYNSAATSAADATGQVAASLTAVSPAAEEAKTAMDNYADALAATTAIDAYTANANLAKSFHDLSHSLKDAGKVTNDEKLALGGFASDVRRTSTAVLEQTGSQAKANAVMARGRDHFIALAEKAGYSARQAKNLADRLLEIPSRTDVTIDADTSPALRQLHALIAAIQSSGATLPVALGTARKVAAGGAGGNAAGGLIRGAGTATSDSIPAYLSDGEFVMRTAAVQRYGVHHFERLNAMGFAAGGATKKPSAADRRQAGQDARGAAAAAAAAARAGAIDARTPGTDTLAEINAAIAAVQRLSDAYAAQQAVVGMSAAERKKYHAEQRVSAVQERLDRRKTAAETRDAAAKNLADNQAGWEFDHLAAADQLTALDKKIAGEKKYSDQWVADSKAREQIAADLAAKQAAADQAALDSIKSALDAAIQERDQKIAQVAGVLTGFGAIGDLNVAGGPNEVIGAQVGATDVVTGGLIAASQNAKVAAARTFIANLRTLRARGLNDASVAEIFNMGPSGGAAYAAALVADSSVLGTLNADAVEFANLGQSFGAELAGAVRISTGTAQQPTTFNLYDSNGVLLGTMYGVADQVAGQIASMGVYGRV